MILKVLLVTCSHHQFISSRMDWYQVGHVVDSVFVGDPDPRLLGVVGADLLHAVLGQPGSPLPRHLQDGLLPRLGLHLPGHEATRQQSSPRGEAKKCGGPPPLPLLSAPASMLTAERPDPSTDSERSQDCKQSSHCMPGLTLLNS